ncbi:MAG: hypothetical protein MI724_08365 [Spirochaetales bacterium]|nr:hypothetical protein [Spirochaetales bacterium]
MSGEKTGTTHLSIGFFYSGVSYQYTFMERPENKERLVPLNAWEMARHDLAVFDLFIVPRGSDQEVLYAFRHKIRAYLEAGGIVASFGEVTTDWLPSVQWDGVVPSDDGPLEFVSAHPILNDLVPVDLHWHKGYTGWCSHGHFREPADGEVLVRTETGDPVMYVDRTSTGGTIIAASEIDVVCHAAHGIDGAQRMFENIVGWIGGLQ